LKNIEKTLNNWITFAYWITRYNKINKNECRFDRIPRVGHSYHSWSEVCPLSRTSRDFRRWPSASNLARASALGVWNAIPPIVKERKLRLSKVHVSQPGNVLGFDMLNNYRLLRDLAGFEPVTICFQHRLPMPHMPSELGGCLL
jgi:hypothetical protein